MKILYSQLHKQHKPKWEFINFEKIANPEVPERIEQIVKELKNNGLSNLFEEPKKFPLTHIKKIHQKNYIDFIKNAAENLKKDESFYASYFIIDTYTPILPATYAAIVEAVNCALTGAELLKKEKVVYALCRPPGHHAEANMMGGYCYFNNAAIAAEYLSKKGKVAILDIDFHHGNGTQHIFYDRSDVLYVSIHADPLVKFPYISGFTDEQGRGKGKGFNKNYPLPLGTTEEEYEKELQKALEDIKKFKPDTLVVSCGFDTYIHDTWGGFKLTIPFYETMARHIASLRLPTLVLQEGGYYIEDLGKMAYSFWKGLQI